ncbi:GTP-binding protein [Chytridiales sp. JEL 0842]|nr:GTP-binding protein [Chytridiales sp. JEL 0842]
MSSKPLNLRDSVFPRSAGNASAGPQISEARNMMQSSVGSAVTTAAYNDFYSASNRKDRRSIAESRRTSAFMESRRESIVPKNTDEDGSIMPAKTAVDYVGDGWFLKHLEIEKWTEVRLSREQAKEYNFDIKVCIAVVGMKGVGKRTLIKKECESKMLPNVLPTMPPDSGIMFKYRTYEIEERLCRVEYWVHTAGDSEMETTAKYAAGLAATIFMMSLNDRRSFEELERWTSLMGGNIFNDLPGIKRPTLLLANRIPVERPDAKKVPEKEVRDFAERYGMLYHECNSLEPETYHRALMSLTRLVSMPVVLELRKERKAGPIPHCLIQGCVQQKTPMPSAQRVRYTNRRHAMRPCKDVVTNTLDWL